MNNQLKNDQDGKQPDNKDPKQGSGKNHQSILAFLICLLVTLVCFALFTNMLKDNSSEISYDKFIDMVDKDQVKEVTIQSSTLTIVPKKQNSKYEDESYYTTKTEDSTALTKRLEGKGIKFETDPPDVFGEFVAMILSVVLPTLLLFGLLMFSMRRMNKGGGIMGMGVGKSKAKAYVQKETGVTFKDVAGQDEAKESLQEVVDFLENPGKYTKLGAKLPKGALLVGPPGTGKTLLAKAVAGEAKRPFFSISGSGFVEMFVGVGASRVRDMFEQAKKAAPSIVFIDEIDAVGRHRGAGLGGGHDEREQTLNQLLVEMDGFDINEGVIVMAATNRRDILDPALLRPGRFDRQVTVNYPDQAGRVAILKVHSKGKKLAADVDLENVAKRMPFSTGAELENVMNEAAILAARGRKPEITQQLLVDAIARVQMGPEKRSHKVSEKDKRLVACHEGGHAIVGHLLPGCDEVHLITIVPRGQAAGHTLSLPGEEHDNMSRSQMLDQVCMCLGGHAAEKVGLGEIYTGSSSDLKRATELCRRMVTMYGMSEEIGTVYLANDEEVFVGMEFGQSRAYSEEVAAQIDREVKRILSRCYARAVQLLENHRAELDRLVEALLQRETLNRREFVALMAGESLPPEAEAAMEKPQPTPDIPPREKKPAAPPEKPEIPDGIFLGGSDGQRV